ncbi:unconventional myosin-VIIa-like [Xyrichtys novacula]|uniref:Unconventional myosin-VIIa-like n=1 Tax=Xyrichtys novacula TaxID=13765 RepID=A0AAV1GEF0_XYRNO|nr:unconventional myosin-VIIa-like [Xyrichtys novacula]
MWSKIREKKSYKLVMLRKGEWVWVDSVIGIPIGAKVKVTPSGQRLLLDDEGQEYSLAPEMEASLKIMHPTSVEGVEDMIKLGDMNEAGVLRNLLLRHKQGKIYTYTGSVLVAVNPYMDYPIYSAEQVRLYQGRKLGELPPHIFGIAESCHSNMKRHYRNQCCIISGESGAGKTESTKLILQYLAAVSGELSEQQIEKQILESNPILEAFGNAKTVRNDNSSRFGKYLEIFFNKDGVIEGARVEQYLLEKSRVCHQSPEERNYHMFYCLLAGVSEEEKKTLSLGKAEEYRFLTQGGCIICDSRNDAKDYKRIRSAMKILNFSEGQCQEILKLLAAILHLGNVCFEANTQNNLESSDVSKSEHFSIAASLLQVEMSSLAASLTHRSIMTNSERMIKPLSSEQASDCRDAFVKAIYNKLFIWIVEKINSVIHKRLIKSPKSSFLSIGLLDIFGFENFYINSFEQLCINFANEKLQQFFVAHIFKLEQKEYQKEDIVWRNIKFSDNQNILDLLAGQPCNLLALIDEESHFPKGTDSTMLNKMNQQHTGNKSYISSKGQYDTDFGIRHFAGMVLYDSKGFLEKNRDAVSSDIIKMIDVSTNKVLRQIFESELSTNGVKISNNKKIIMTPKSSLRAQTDGRKQVPTLSGQFRQSLDSLMKALSACQPFFIRCFKPNNEKQSKLFDRELCMRQLRYSGMMDTIRIRKLGYPIRHTFKDFLTRYRVLLKTTICDPKTTSAAACCEAICRTVIKGEDQWKIGTTKVFLKDTHDAFLERLREEELGRKAVVIQRVMMGHKDRKSFLKKRKAALVLQKNWRAYKQKEAARKLLKGYQRLTARIKSRNLQHHFQKQREAAIIIQSQIRGYRARKDFKQKKRATIKLQAHTRGVLARRKAVKTKNGRKSESETRRSEVVEQVKIIISPSSKSPTPAPSLKEDDTDDEFDEDNDEFAFHKFRFQSDATHKHIMQRLKEPLLHHDDEGDVLACLTVFWIILRYMEDMPEPKNQDAHSLASSTLSSPMTPRRGRRLSSLVGLDQKFLRRNKKKPGGGRKTSTIFEEPEELTEEEGVMIGEGPKLHRYLTSQEKLNIIIGYALFRPDIRDEIYCQICKQLVENRNRRSRMLGWTLLSICLGIFPPTDHFMKYLECFVRKGPSGYGEYCTERLRRIKANGERKELPCWLEVQAAKSKESLNLEVAITDGRFIGVSLDSASTSAEVCQAVADKIDLRDTYGFSLYISMFDKMWSLGSCGNHVLDAISQCEQEMRRQGRREKDTPWRLSIRKELFRPWHDCSEDKTSTDLIYRQFIMGIKSEEYTSEKEDEYVQMAARHYYTQFGSVNKRDNVERVVDECIPTPLIENKSKTRWVQLVSEALSQDTYARGEKKAESVKGELVDHARQSWPVYFSKFYDVTMMSGPPLPKSRFFVAVNWNSVLFADGRDRRLLELPYLGIKEIRLMREDNVSAQSVSLTTVKGLFVLKSAEAEDMAALIEENLEGLRQRSMFAVAQQNTTKQGDQKLLACKRGDLLLVEKEKDYPPKDKLINATNQRTSNRGTVHMDSVQFLPTLNEPSEDMLKLLSPGSGRPSQTQVAPQREGTVAPASLKEFALENFRSTGKDGGRQGASRGVTREKLWACTKEPLKQPLLKSLYRKSELSNLACNFMGDYPIKHARSPLELTDQIFGPATQHQELRDEIYCQIMRQMTNNNNRLSVDRGWQLMWLCTGLFPPSPTLMMYTQLFLESRPKDHLSAICLQRVKAMLSKEPRQLPPHMVEVDAIQQNSNEIFHKIHFPNETDEIIEVSSTTTIQELCHTIALRLQLSSVEGYGLYLKTRLKITTMEDDRYFFDSLRQTSDGPKKAKKIKEGPQSNMPYLVIFKRKLWFNVSPGKDLKADFTFHFPQEQPKYLKGYHNCSKQDLITLAGLLFRTQVDSDRSQFIMIPRLLKGLVPANQIGIMSPDEWKKHIIASYTKQSGMTVDEAKIEFLKAISGWPTFGCAFFDVKQDCDYDYPEEILVVVSKQGVGLMDKTDKGMLVMHQFSRIVEYTSKGNVFQMTIGTLLKNVNFVCETPQARAIEDLIRSYVTMYERQREAFLPRTQLMFF